MTDNADNTSTHLLEEDTPYTTRKPVDEPSNIDISFASKDEIYKKLVADTSSAQVILEKDISPQDIIIMVMGPTGTGKTSFIRGAVGNGTTEEEDPKLQLHVGHRLDSKTNVVTCVKIPIPTTKQNFVLVDTPGFDDGAKSDAKVLECIADWLKSTYKRGICLSGIIYLHRINDIRLDTGVQNTLTLFQRICGGFVFNRINLVTTMWNEVPPERGEIKEKQLVDSKYWQPMTRRGDGKRGAFVTRFNMTTVEQARETALEAMWKLAGRADRKMVLLLQQELVDDKKSLPKTQAGQMTYSVWSGALFRAKEFFTKDKEEAKE
ncbi:hypothetical protein CVT24_001358 [Panaeolus cyanescens]|uniref:G domain-containing protein n=1 Tax=Panaeolus cyanescens TaxID=181874 RepID=A0A409YFU7_9AGAR|nr:hypothetical protein CVT24_001358 [Panaeolus cyanescens]